MTHDEHEEIQIIDTARHGAELLSPVLHDSHFGGEVEIIEAVPAAVLGP